MEAYSIFVKSLHQLKLLLSTVASYNTKILMLYNSIMLSYNVDMGSTLYNLLLYRGNTIQGTTVFGKSK